ncbi:MAG: adenosylmethionine decarboxylase, partial [Thermoplasmata archaeon M11B2D]
IPDNIHEIIEDGISHSKMTVVDKLSCYFSPQGETVVWILAESHFTLHTYPEYEYISMDCYTCGEEGNPLAAMEHIIGALGVEKYKMTEIGRGEV